MEFALKCAYAYGTKAIRTHLDSLPPQEDISWPVFEMMRERWAGRIDLQAACLFGIDRTRDENGSRRWSTGSLRPAACSARSPSWCRISKTCSTWCSARRSRTICDLDFHADETDALEAVSLRMIAEAAKRHGYEGRILVGHCCSLARQPDDEVCARSTPWRPATDLGRVAADVQHVSAGPPLDGTTPRWRGVTLLHEMKARGINVCVASDNTRDPFYAYGDLDMIEVYRMATRIGAFRPPGCRLAEDGARKSGAGDGAG
jgi:cytosine deaminase